jgi:predicted transcriptional regulator
MKDIIDRMFGGSAESLVMSLVQTRHLTPEKLERLRRRLDEQTEEDDGDD